MQWVRVLTLVGRFDPFGGMVEVVWLHEQQNTQWCKISNPLLSIRTLCIAYAGIRTLSATYVLSTYCLQPTHVFLYCIRTVYVLSPYSIHTVYADSTGIRTPIWSAEKVRTPQTEYRCRRRQYGVRSQYGLTLSAASAAYMKHEITFKIGLRIVADRSGNPQTHYGYSTHTVRIPSGSRRIEHLPRSAASVRRCERGITALAIAPW